MHNAKKTTVHLSFLLSESSYFCLCQFQTIAYSQKLTKHKKAWRIKCVTYAIPRLITHSEVHYAWPLIFWRPLNFLIFWRVLGWQSLCHHELCILVSEITIHHLRLSYRECLSMFSAYKDTSCQDTISFVDLVSKWNLCNCKIPMCYYLVINP